MDENSSRPIEHRTALVTIINRGTPPTPTPLPGVSPEKLVQLISPHLREQGSLKIGESGVKRPLFVEDVNEPLKAVLAQLEVIGSDVRKLQEQDIVNKVEIEKLKEENKLLRRDLGALEEEQIANFLRCVTDGWLKSSKGSTKLMGTRSVEEIKGLLRNIERLEDEKSKLVRAGGATQGLIRSKEFRIRTMEAELADWRRSVDRNNALGGREETTNLHLARQLQALLGSYVQVNEKLHPKVKSVRWKKLSEMALRFAKDGKLKVEGHNVSEIVTIFLEDLDD